jgi:hypothetical protein
MIHAILESLTGNIAKVAGMANFDTWGGNIAEIGPIYPMVGWEVFWVVLGLAAWIIFHILQIRMEEKEMREHSDAHGDRDSLTEIMARESLIMEKQARREMF